MTITLKQLQSKINTARYIEVEDLIKPPCCIKGCSKHTEYIIETDNEYYNICEFHFNSLDTEKY